MTQPPARPQQVGTLNRHVTVVVGGGVSGNGGGGVSRHVGR